MSGPVRHTCTKEMMWLHQRHTLLQFMQTYTKVLITVIILPEFIIRSIVKVKSGECFLSLITSARRIAERTTQATTFTTEIAANDHSHELSRVNRLRYKLIQKFWPRHKRHPFKSNSQQLLSHSAILSKNKLITETTINILQTFALVNYLCDGKWQNQCLAWLQAERSKVRWRD